MENPTTDGGAVAPDAPEAPAETGLERGSPSAYLTQAQGGVLDTSDGGYKSLTEGVPEKGVFTIVGGYVDAEGVVHNEVELRAMSGHEEDLLGNRSIPVTQRMTGIMSSCVKRIGTITDRGQISKAVNALPTGSRTHLLICMRRTTHWKRTKDIYEMEVRCPSSGCKKIDSYKVDLSELTSWGMPDPAKHQYELALDDSEAAVTWKIPTGAEDQILAVVADSPASEAEILSYMIMVRLVIIAGKRVELGVSDFLDNAHKKLKLSKASHALLVWVKDLSVNDREQFREAFELNEPGIDTDLEFECKACRQEFNGNLNVAQETFFFPSAMSRRSKRRSST